MSFTQRNGLVFDNKWQWDDGKRRVKSADQVWEVSKVTFVEEYPTILNSIYKSSAPSMHYSPIISVVQLELVQIGYIN